MCSRRPAPAAQLYASGLIVIEKGNKGDSPLVTHAVKKEASRLCPSPPPLPFPPRGYVILAATSPLIPCVPLHRGSSLYRLYFQNKSAASIGKLHWKPAVSDVSQCSAAAAAAAAAAADWCNTIYIQSKGKYHGKQSPQCSGRFFFNSLLLFFYYIPARGTATDSRFPTTYPV